MQKTQELLLQSERLAALGELSAKIAHEVNNPLGIIKNYLLLLERNANGDNTNAENIKIIGQEIDRIAIIVKQLLDFHRPRMVKFVDVNLRHVLDEVLVLMRRQLNDSGIEVEINIPENMPLITAWSDGLKQVFLNLFINAREAMKGGGKVMINVTVEKFLLKIKFKDTGPGIEEKHIPHIFEPFYTTKESSGGSGLGLSVCYGIIKNHGGSIVYCNAEPGSCFEIKLPIARKEVYYDWRI